MTPLGYNHDLILNAWKAGVFEPYLSHNINFAEYPPLDIADFIWDTMFLNQPSGMTEVYFAPTPSLAFEQAIKAALLWNKQGLKDYSSQDFNNETYHGSVLTFNGNNHSKTLAGVEAVGGHANVGLPAF